MKINIPVTTNVMVLAELYMKCEFKINTFYPLTDINAKIAVQTLEQRLNAMAFEFQNKVTAALEADSLKERGA